MKFEQVIQAIRDGKQVLVDNYDPIIQSKWTSENSICLNLLLSDKWEIVPEYVDFAEAWKAYEEGKTIKSLGDSRWQTEKYSKKISQDFCAFTAKEIRGKWGILEGE